MKILIVYYSRTGLTKKVGAKLAAALSADQEVITDKTERAGVIGYLRCGREAIKKEQPDIDPIKFDPAAYDLVIVGTPVWAAHMSSPIRSYLSEQKDKIKRIAFFATQGGTTADGRLGEVIQN